MMAGGIDLGKQIGPLPLGAWLAVVGTGLGIAYYTRQNQALPDESERDLSGEDAVGTGVNGQWVDVTPPEVGPGEGPPTDNDEWGRRAIDYLIAQGYNAAIAQSAIAKALQGTIMSVQEWTLWKIALTKLGAPPFPLDVVPPVSVPKPPKPKPKPKPRPAPRKHPRVYKVRRGDTLAELAQRFYGNKTKWRRIFNANKKGKRRPGLRPGWLTQRMTHKNLQPGRYLLIPK